MIQSFDMLYNVDRIDYRHLSLTLNFFNLSSTTFLNVLVQTRGHFFLTDELTPSRRSNANKWRNTRRETIVYVKYPQTNWWIKIKYQISAKIWGYQFIIAELLDDWKIVFTLVGHACLWLDQWLWLLNV